MVRSASILVLGSGRRAVRVHRRLTAAGFDTVGQAAVLPGEAAAPLAADVVVLVTGGATAHLGAAVGHEFSRSTKHSRDTVVIVASHPTDAWCEAVWRASALPVSRVLGVAGGAYAARLRRLVAAAAGVAVDAVEAPILSGGRAVLPLVEHVTVDGVPVSQVLSRAQIAAVLGEAATAGRRSEDEEAAAVAELVDAVVSNQKRLLPATVRLDGEYGLRGVWLGVPCLIARAGVERIVELPLGEAEQRRRVQRWGRAARRRLTALGERSGPA